jgi:hypothetical protein
VGLQGCFLGFWLPPDNQAVIFAPSRSLSLGLSPKDVRVNILQLRIIIEAIQAHSNFPNLLKLPVKQRIDHFPQFSKTTLNEAYSRLKDKLGWEKRIPKAAGEFRKTRTKSRNQNVSFG